MIRKDLMQVGVIVYGNGLNTRTAIDGFKARGFTVMLRAGFCEIWR